MPLARPRIVAALALALAVPLPAIAQTGSVPETYFDHYLLALTWMPSFCELEGDAREDARCAPGSAHGWMVHGLWPQQTGGRWPEFCETPHRNPSRRDTAAQADLYGAGHAAWHQWNKHGRCSGLSAGDYYALTRAALDRFTLPDLFDGVTDALTVSPAVIEHAFIEANPALDEQMMVTTCRSDAIVELRLCLTRDLMPRICDAELFLRECALDAARLPGLRIHPSAQP